MDALFIERNVKRFNYAIPYILSYLIRKDVSLELMVDPSPVQIQRKIKTARPKFVFLSLKWFDQLSDTLTDARLIKSKLSSCKVVLGGISSNILAKELINMHEVDMIIQGDAEKPIYHLIKNKKPLNILSKEGVSEKWVQKESDLKDVFLVDDKRIGIEIIKSLNYAYIWFGKGCKHNCFYCAGNKKTHEVYYGRKNIIYRPKDKIIKDINLCAKYCDLLFFDFEPEKKATNFQIEIFKSMNKLPVTGSHVLWSVPPNVKLIKEASKKFKFNYILVDLVSFSERLRFKLANLGYIKKTCTDKQLISFLDQISKLKNVSIRFDTIVGLPHETSKDIKDSIIFLNYLMNKFPKCIDVNYSCNPHPLHNQLGSSLFTNPKKYQFKSAFNKNSPILNQLRKKFDFFFKKGIEYPYHSKLSKKQFLEHSPYGGTALNTDVIEVKCRNLLFLLFFKIKLTKSMTKLKQIINYVEKESYNNIKVKKIDGKLRIFFYGRRIFS